MILKYLPNILTLSRLILILPFLYALGQHYYLTAFYLFLIAGLTDGLDGWIARRYQWQTALGSYLDPLADKLLVAASFISLGFLKVLPWWLVILVFLRDLTIITGVICWYFFIQRPVNFKPTVLSKMNTAFQLSLVILCLLDLAFFITPPTLMLIFISLTTLTTLASYLDYVLRWGGRAYRFTHSPSHE